MPFLALLITPKFGYFFVPPLKVKFCAKSRFASKRITWITAFAEMTPRLFSIKNYDAVYRNP